MKYTQNNHPIGPALMVCLIICLTVLPVSADYEISWSTIGQPDAGDMAGGDYQLSGGFWPRGLIPLLCFVNFEHFAAFALYWLDSPCDVGNNWCDGADLDYYGDVDLEDVKVLAYYWLSACPEDWPWE